MIQNRRKHTFSTNDTPQNSSNVSTQIPEGYNQVQEVNSGAGNKECKIEIPNLYLHFFFDGTCNNKHNTKVRLQKLNEKENSTDENDTLLLDTKKKCDEFAEKEYYKKFNISFKDLHKKCSGYKKAKEIENQKEKEPRYIDVLSPTEKALQNIDRPKKPELTYREDVNMMRMAEFKETNKPYDYADNLYPLHKDNKKYLNK